VSYSHQTLDMGMRDHPVAKLLPKATDGPSLHPGPLDFQVFAAREDAPTTLEDFIYQDIPLLSLHITSFNDATLVALSWPHVLMDVMGQQALLHGWAMVLAGRVSEVPPFLGAREDAISVAAAAPAEDKEEYKLSQQQLKGWGMLSFGLRFTWNLLWNRAVESRTIFLPKRVVAELHRQAQDDLASELDGEDTPFLSEGDVLTAWAVRAVASSLPHPRPVTVLHALNTRFRLSSLVQASGVHVQNMVIAAFAFLPSGLPTGSLGPIALANRRQLMEQSTEAQVLASLRKMQIESSPGSDPAMLYGDPTALLIPTTNWTRADLYKIVNFSPAVVRAGETWDSRSNPPGTMVFHHAASTRQSLYVRNVIVVMGKDHGDNYWLTGGNLLPPAWAKIEDDLKERR
jgi:hypothetical protein